MSRVLPHAIHNNNNNNKKETNFNKIDKLQNNFHVFHKLLQKFTNII